jgi:RNA polymerase sigma-70 factor (ECF subfamily)
MGDEHTFVALERVYDEHAQALFAFLLNLTRDEADTRDLLQEIFFKLARQPQSLRSAREPRAFLLRLAHNLAIDMFRRRQSQENTCGGLENEAPAALFAPSSNPDETILRDKLAAALGALPPDQRAVVHLKLWEGMTFEAIATLLEIPLNTAASRYRYGLDKMREHLRPLYEELK